MAATSGQRTSRSTSGSWIPTAPAEYLETGLRKALDSLRARKPCPRHGFRPNRAPRTFGSSSTVNHQTGARSSAPRWAECAHDGAPAAALQRENPKDKRSANGRCSEDTERQCGGVQKDTERQCGGAPADTERQCGGAPWQTGASAAAPPEQTGAPSAAALPGRWASMRRGLSGTPMRGGRACGGLPPVLPSSTARRHPAARVPSPYPRPDDSGPVSHAGDVENRSRRPDGFNPWAPQYGSSQARSAT